MKILIFASVLLLSYSIASGQSLNDLDAKYGFKTTRLGSRIGEFKSLENVDSVSLKSKASDQQLLKTEDEYRLANDRQYYDRGIELKIGAYPVEYVKYEFYKDTLITINVQLAVTEADEPGIIKALESAYGKGTFVSRSGDEFYEWEGRKVYMSFRLINDFWNRLKPVIHIESKSLVAWKDKDLSDMKIEFEHQRDAERAKEWERQRNQNKDAAHDL